MVLEKKKKREGHHGVDDQIDQEPEVGGVGVVGERLLVVEEGKKGADRANKEEAKRERNKNTASPFLQKLFAVAALQSKSDAHPGN